MFEVERILKFAPSCSKETAEKLSVGLETSVAEFEVTTLNRRSHFLGQVSHESGGFVRFKENLNYSAERIPQVWSRLASRANELAHDPEKLGNAAYAGKNGNGNEASGDGFKFCGRGLIQLTGRGNYAQAGDALRIDLLTDPAKAADPEIAVKIALWFFESRGCNVLADEDDVAAVTKKINGGNHGLEDRRVLTAKAKSIFT